MADETITRPTIPFEVINNSGRSGTPYLFLYGNTDPLRPQGNTYFMSKADGTLTKFTPGQKGLKYGVPLPTPTTKAAFPQLDAVRAYISLGGPLVIDIDKDGLPIPPSADLASDPNFQTIWDFIEATWHDYGNRTVLHMNVTQVDAFGLAFKLEHNGFDPADPTKPLTVTSGFNMADTRHGVITTLFGLGAPWKDLLVSANFASEPVRRVLMPLKAMDLGKFPKDQLQGYIAQVALYYMSGPKLVFSYAGVDYTGTTKTNGDFAFVPNKATDDGGNATSSYLIKVPNTRQCYAQDIISQPNDGPGSAICAALGASFLRSTLKNYTAFPVPQEDRGLYYQNEPICQYAKVIHSYGIDGHAFCYGYDEVAGDAGANRDVVKPQWARLTIGKV